MKQPTPTSAREPEKFKYENNIRPKQEKFDDNDFYDDEEDDLDEDMDDEDNIGDNDKSVDFFNNAIPERVVKSVRSTPTKKKEIPELKMKTELEEEISMGEVDPETLLEWLQSGAGEERAMPLIALEQLCMLLLMSDKVDR